MGVSAVTLEARGKLRDFAEDCEPGILMGDNRGFYLIAYLSWYVLPINRIVPHWPLDFVVTMLAGAILLYHGFMEALDEWNS